MTNKELQDLLKQFPDDFEVEIDDILVRGCPLEIHSVEETDDCFVLIMTNAYNGT